MLLAQAQGQEQGQRRSIGSGSVYVHARSEHLQDHLLFDRRQHRTTRPGVPLQLFPCLFLYHDPLLPKYRSDLSALVDWAAQKSIDYFVTGTEIGKYHR